MEIIIGKSLRLIKMDLKYFECNAMATNIMAAGISLFHTDQEGIILQWLPKQYTMFVYIFQWSVYHISLETSTTREKNLFFFCLKIDQHSN